MIGATLFLPMLAAMGGQAATLESAGMDAGAIEAVIAPRFAEAEARNDAGRGDPLPPPPPPPPNWQEIVAPPAPDQSAPEVDADDQLIDGRRRPGFERDLPDRLTQDNPGAVTAPPPEAFPTDQIPLPDRWRLIELLGVVKERCSIPTTRTPTRATGRSTGTRSSGCPSTATTGSLSPVR